MGPARFGAGMARPTRCRNPALERSTWSTAVSTNAVTLDLLSGFEGPSRRARSLN